MMASHGRGPGRGGGGGGGAGRGRGRTGAGGRGRIQSSRDVTPSSEPDPESIPSTDASRPRSTTSSRHQSGSASGSDPLSEPPAADQPGDAPVTAQWAPEYPHTRFHPVIGEYIRGPADPPTAPERPRGEFRRELWPAETSFFPFNVGRALGEIIRANFHGPYLNFTSVPPNVQYVWLDELRRTYWWPPHREEGIRMTYRSACSKKIQDMIHDLKMGHTRPNWIRQEYYEDLLGMLDNPAYKEKSEKAKVNQSAAGLHTGGSRTHSTEILYAGPTGGEGGKGARIDHHARRVPAYAQKTKGRELRRREGQGD
ncbi:hypothetical protein M6B38_397615 [Iris pallida]|uniref:Gag protein n=1 Tax=Iris pallida TaxID=29817 RepID=A0AAX6FWY1_IRIPA|nr:hypothetical protein M6B38_397615 [Iris pallida]